MKIEYQKNALIVMIGAMGTGKSTFARRHFFTHDIVETDFIRKQLSGDSEDQTHNNTTFEILFATIDARAKAGILTVIDSTGSRSVLEHVRQIGKKYDRPIIAIKFPHLDDSELTKERMQHRMRVLFAYHQQVKRIDETIIHSDYIVYDLSKEDVDDSTVTLKQNMNFYLDASKNYIVVPDLHGEYYVVERLLEIYNNKNISFIFLGDVVDRGKSSFRTFKLVNELIESGRGFAVSSNHDYKFSRYLKKWMEDINPEKYYDIGEFDEPKTYGMHLSHGLEMTVREFYSLTEVEMNWYADTFVKYFDATAPHLILEKNKVKNFFTHAGISHNAARGFDPVTKDKDVAMFKTIETVDVVLERFMFDKKNRIILHVGHNWMADVPMLFTKGNVGLYQHDVGIGKRNVDYDTVVKNFVRV